MIAATICAALVAVAPIGPQDAVATSTEVATDPLAPLVRAVSGTQAFRATYRLRVEGGEELEAELLYSAPDRARLRFESETTSTTIWFLEGVQHARGTTAAGATFGTYDAREFMAEVPSVHVALAREFPATLPGPDLGPGPVFHFEANLSADAGPALSVAISFARVRPSLFCFGYEHRARLGQARADDAGVVFGARDGLFLALDAGHGFPTAARGLGEASAASIELIGLELAPPADAEFAVPDPTPEARNTSAEVVGSARYPFTPQPQRVDAWWAMVGLLERGAVTWDDDSRARFGRVFEELHTLFLPNRFEDLILASDATSAEEVERILIDHGTHPLDDRRAEVDAVLEQIDQSMAVVRERYLTPLVIPAELAAAAPTEWLERLLEVELEYAGALFDAEVVAPIRGSFERRSRALLK